MMKWLGLALGRLSSCELLDFDDDHAYTFDGLKCWASTHSRNKIELPCKVEFNHRLLGLSSFTT